ncbi:calmodulin-A [Strongylocentrotus purpuratus]|uniref:EF-hand domain-containing protein n=1 Tax=Strongylocentrotus purpuratus TaxID=7668 RepID=A0A7M7RF82_STRPU|nr:calmodulin-A [Strongylocentrotus purpuratus]
MLVISSCIHTSTHTLDLCLLVNYSARKVTPLKGADMASQGTEQVNCEGTLHSSRLTTEQMEEYREAFNSFDRNNDGVISVDEFGDVIRTLGQNPTKKDIEDAVKRFDENKNGTIEFNEFIKMIDLIPFNDKDQEQEELRKAFQLFDKDGNGYISAAELKLAMTTLGEPLTDDEVAEMIANADIDQDGKINYEEFVEMIVQSSENS